jgi:uncharacterized membrane protein (UPF0127 family)
MVVDFSFKFKNKIITLKVKKLTTIIQQSSGLMFKKKSPPLLFIQKKPVRHSIHSFFCKPLIAIWLLDNKIIDIKLINPNQLSIKPKEKFDKLLEIPNNTKEFKEIIKFIDDTANI